MDLCLGSVSISKIDDSGENLVNYTPLSQVSESRVDTGDVICFIEKSILFIANCYYYIYEEKHSSS